MQQFSINVGNNSDVNGHTPCAHQNSVVSKGGLANLSCIAVGRYVSFRMDKGSNVTICEFVVMGHPARTEGKHVI